jgi:hypothetical protein
MSCRDILLRHTPLVVTLHFRGLRPIGVSPYWLGDPGRAYKTQKSHAHSGIPADPPVTPPKRSNSSHAVAPTTGFNPTWPADLAAPSAPKNRKKPTRSATLMEFLPLRRMSPSESTPRRLATPTTFRPQGFSPSRRIPPRSDARPCFMPVTPMGFALQGFSLTVRSSGSSPKNYPPGVSPPHCRVNSAIRGARSPQHSIEGARVTSLCRLQGLAPTVNPYRRWTVISVANGRSPPELSAPLQGLTHRLQATPRVTCAALALCPLALKQPVPGRARNQPQARGVRSSGFARKHGTSLRKAKYPLLRFSWPSRP